MEALIEPTQAGLLLGHVTLQESHRNTLDVLKQQLLRLFRHQHLIQKDTLGENNLCQEGLKIYFLIPKY